MHKNSTMHENDPEVLEREKHRNLSRSSKKSSDLHDNAPGWNETLASASEASVKVRGPLSLHLHLLTYVTSFIQADRSDTNVKDMISKTVEFMREKRVENEENGFSTTAIYRRDEVKGPLADKGDSMVHTTEVKTQKTDHRGTPLKADEILLEEDWKGEMTRSEEAVSQVMDYQKKV